MRSYPSIEPEWNSTRSVAQMKCFHVFQHFEKMERTEVAIATSVRWGQEGHKGEHRSSDRLLGIVDFPDSRPEPNLEAIHFLKSLLVHDFTLTPVPFVLRCLILE